MAGTGLSIRAVDYNDLQSDVEELLGTSSSGTYGYGQTVRSSPVEEDDKVTINEYNNLRTDLLNIAFHQTGSLPSDTTGSGNLLSLNAGEKIEFDATDEPFNQYVNNLVTYRSNRFNVFSGNTRTVNIVDDETPISRTWDNTLGEYWRYGIECTVTVSFNSAVAARHFFNSGGKIRFSSRRTGGTTSGGTSTIRAQNESWSSLLQTTVGNRDFGGNTPGTGTSPLTGENFYRLTNTFVNPFVDISASGDYSSNRFLIYARTPAIANNSSGTASVIEFYIRWLDLHTANSLDGPDGIDGTMELFVNSVEPVQSLLPSGSWLLETPTIQSQTQITNVSLQGSLTSFAFPASLDDPGFSLSTSRLLTVVGSPNADDDRSNSGMILVYDNYTNTKITELYDPNPGNVAFVNNTSNVSGWQNLSTNANFGYAVSVSDTYIAVSAVGETNNSSGGTGSVYLYSATTRNLLRRIQASANSVRFGDTLAVSDSYLAIGDRTFDSSEGRVQLYNPATGAFIRTISNPNATSNDFFGDGLAITSTRLIVGAPREDQAGSNSGTAYCFNLSNGNLVYSINNPAVATPADDRYGWRIAANEDYMIIGAYNAAGGGKAYIHEVSTGSLIHTLDNPNPYSTTSGDQFGYVVAMGDRYCAVSARLEDQSGFNNSGKVYLYSILNGNLVKTINNPDPAAGDNFGDRVAMSSEYISIIKDAATNLYIERTVELGDNFDSE